MMKFTSFYMRSDLKLLFSHKTCIFFSDSTPDFTHSAIDTSPLESADVDAAPYKAAVSRVQGSSAFGARSVQFNVNDRSKRY